MAQMLMVLQAVQFAEPGQVTHPADALDEMRERFLMFGVRAPFGWITRLRDDDDQTLSYKELQLSMSGFR
ncbi:hypothetical protein CBS115989_7196 [Aspergillus niger]|uniref:Uncharacterized protein n=1 Tax=Aspergillus niger TaxID=5061 RepID=A0A9W6A5B2_ASPNG|nr:hypothetical protein CBS115989_7196 [Aspergillus niger]KAI2848598.1 hypothetical protein CBS11232_6818 [Aspergillus niger]KAI2870580.1 hypothetical protein CBS115988_9199 [Aspergillus niger]KAI2914627.1 hypothetical protein CBS147320_10249 [Aspergillus niger]KAI2919141.1 hypothetical protein CBS147371_3846 [Aspergillus niger]